MTHLEFSSKDIPGLADVVSEPTSNQQAISILTGPIGIDISTVIQEVANHFVDNGKSTLIVDPDNYLNNWNAKIQVREIFENNYKRAEMLLKVSQNFDIPFSWSQIVSSNIYYSEPQNPHNGLRSNLYGSTTLAEATSAGF
jgi:hypothetical protein